MDATFRDDTPVSPLYGVPNGKEEPLMFTKEEVVAILNDMKIQTDQCNGFIIGTVTKSWVYQMIDEKIQEVMKDSHLPPE